MKSRLLKALAAFLGMVAAYDLIVWFKARLETSSERSPLDNWITGPREFEPPAPRVRRSVILVHGFCGSPFDFKPLADELKSAYRLRIPVVPGQTKISSAYRRGGYSPAYYVRWLERIIDEETARSGKAPYLVGLSMGGALATVVAARARLAGLVLISPFYSLPWANTVLWRVSRVFCPFVPVVLKFPRGNINDPARYREYQPGSMLISLSAFDRLQQLATVARRKAPSVKETPVLILASPNDRAASFETTRSVFGRMENVEIAEYPRSNHLLLHDYDREEAVSRIAAFLRAGDGG